VDPLRYSCRPSVSANILCASPKSTTLFTRLVWIFLRFHSHGRSNSFPLTECSTHEMKVRMTRRMNVASNVLSIRDSRSYYSILIISSTRHYVADNPCFLSFCLLIRFGVHLLSMCLCVMKKRTMFFEYLFHVLWPFHIVYSRR
jgi:hypothetical protein